MGTMNEDTPQGQVSSGNSPKPQSSGDIVGGPALPQNSGAPATRNRQFQPHPKWWQRIDWSQAVLDLLLLIVGIKLAFIYSGQLTAMRDSNEINRESLTSVQRAFVSFQHFEYFRLQDPDHSNVHHLGNFGGLR